MRILEINKFYPPHIGGIETLVQQRVTYFSQRQDVQVKALVCQEQGSGLTEHYNGTEIIRCSSAGTFFSCPLSLEFLHRFRSLAAWADVVEVHTPFPLGDLACLLSGCSCRVVIAWHSDVVRQKKLLALYKPLLHRFLCRADAIITATPGHIASSAFLPEFREKCHIIPYPFDGEAYRRAKQSPVLTNRLHSPGAVKVLFAGRLVYYKGVEFLIEAFRKVHGCELFVCGTGALEETLKEQATGLPVHFLGRLSDNDLKAAFADCDLFVLPSVENAEAFGIVQQEAMTFGKPVINTALPTGVPYVSVHGETGLTVPPRDVNALAEAIQMLTDCPELRELYGRNAAAKVRKDYDYEANLSKILHVLKGDAAWMHL